MSATIDERIVKMEFDNKEFEKNVATSLSTLDKLKNALTFTKQKETLSTLSNAIDTKGFDAMGKSVEVVRDKFSALEVAGMAALAKITSQAVDAGERLVKSLSIDQIATGWDKYARITSSVQTILAATRDQGETMESVTEQIEKLSWFTDETSYSLNDMTDNIAKFTSSGIELKSATTDMQGIAVAAALAGANTQEASHAMSGFSKAMGEGSMKRQHWQWIQTAHVDTMQFKQTLIDTAVELGTLKEVGEGVYETLEGNEVTVTNFETAMKDAWITTDVMSNTLELYGAFSDQLYEASKMTGLSASELLSALEDYQNGGLDLNELAKETGKSAEDLSMIMQVLDQDALSLGNKAFRAAQEAKTFQEAIDSVKDAVSSGWMKTFDIIFGNYEEAKVLWTDFANAMYDVFAESGNTRNEILSLWKELGGRTDLIEGLANAFHALIDPLNAAKEGFASVFPDNEGYAQILFNLTNRFKEFTESLLLSDENLDKIRDAFARFGEITQQTFITVRDFAYAVSPLGKVLSALINSIIKIASAFKRLFDRIKNSRKSTKETVDTFDNLHDKIDAVSDILVGAIDKVTEFIEGLIDNRLFEFIDFFRNAIDSIKSFNEETGILTNAIKFLGTVIAAPFYLLYQLVTIIGSFISKMLTLPEVQRVAKLVFDTIITFGKDAYEKIKGVVDYLKNLDMKTFFSDIKKWFSDAKKNVLDFFDGLSDKFAIVKTIKEEIEKAVENFKLLTGGVSAHTLYDDLETPMNDAEEATFNLQTALEEATKRIKIFFDTIDADKLIALGFAITMTGMFLAVWRLVNSFRDLTDVAKGTLKSIRSPFDALSNTIKSFGKKQENQFKQFAEAILMLVASLSILALMDSKYHANLINAAVMLGALGVSLTIFVGVFTIFAKRLQKVNGFKELLTLDATMLAFSTSLLILTGALRILESVDFVRAQAAILMIAEMGAIMTVLTIVLTKFAGNGITGFLSLLVFAFTINKFAKAVKDISEANFKNAQENILGLAAVFGGLALVAVAASKIGLFSSVGLFITLLALDKFIPMIKDIIKNSNFAGGFDAVLTILENHIDVIKTIGEIAVAMTLVSSFLGGGIRKFGKGMLMFGIALVVMGKAINILGSIDPKVAEQGTEVVQRVFILFAGLSLILGLTNGGSKAVKIALAIGLMTLALYPLAGAMWVISKISESGHNVKEAARVIEDIMICFALIVGAAALGDTKVSFGSIIALVSGIAILAAELIVLSLLPVENIEAAGVSLGIVLTTFGIMLSQFSKVGNQKHPIIVIFQMITMAALIGVLGHTLKVLTTFTWDRVIASALGLSAVLLALSEVFRIMSNGEYQIELADIAAYLAIALALIPIAIAIAGLSFFGGSWENMLSSAVSMGIVLLALGETFKIISSTEDVADLDDVKTVLALSLSLLPIGLAIWALSNYGGSWDKMIASAVSMGIALLALGASFRMIADSKGIVEPKEAAAVFVLSLSLLPIAGALLLLSNYGGEWNKMIASAIAISIVIGVLSIVCYALTKAGLQVIPAIKAAAALGLFIDILALLIGGMAFFVAKITKEEWDNIEEGLNRMIVVMGKTGDMIGAFLGGVLGGAVMKVMEDIGLGLELFSQHANVFTTWIQTIDNKVAEGAKNLAVALLYLTAGELMQSLIGFVTGPLGKYVLKQSFQTLGEGVKAFAEAVADVDANKVKNAAEAAQAILGIDAPNEGGLIAAFTGDNKLWFFNPLTLGELGFGGGIRAFADITSGISLENVQGAINVAQAIFDLDPPNSGGIVAAFSGDNSLWFFNPLTLGEFGFGGGISKFAEAVSGITLESVQGGISIAQALFDLDPPNSGGLIAAFTGDNRLWFFNPITLGGAGFGGGISKFAEAVSGITLESVQGGIAVAKALFELDPPNEGGLIAKITGDNQLWRFNRITLGLFGGGIAGFAEQVSGVSWSACAGGVAIARALCSITPKSRDGSLLGLIAGGTYASLNKAALGEDGIGGGIAAFATAIKDLSEDQINKAKTCGEILSVLDEITPPKTGGFVGWLRELVRGKDEDNFKALGENFASLGKAVSAFTTEAINADPTRGQQAIENLQSILDLLKNTEKFDETKITGFANAMNQAGDLGIKAFCDSFYKAQEKIDAAIGSFASKVNTAIQNNQTSINTSMSTLAQNPIDSYTATINANQPYVNATMEELAQGSMASLTGENGFAFDTSGYSSIIGDMGINFDNSLVTGLIDSNALQGVHDSGSDVAKEVLNGLMSKDAFDMSSLTSPSETMNALGIKVPEGLGSGMLDPSALGGVTQNAQEVVKAISNELDTSNSNSLLFWDKLVEKGRNVIRGFAAGLGDTNLIDQSAGNVGSLASKVNAEWDNYWKIHSPSKVAEEHATYVMEGYALGFRDHYGTVMNAASALGEEAYNALTGSTKNINDYVSENLDLNPSVTPFLDITGLQRDASNINSLFEDSQGLTINSHLGAMTDMFGEMNANSLLSNNQIVSSLQSLHEDVQNLQNVVGNLQVIMDSGTLVGAIAPNMDVALGQMAMYKRRGM